MFTLLSDRVGSDAAVALRVGASGVSMEKPTTELPVLNSCASFQSLRFKVAINHFKRSVLGAQHVAGAAQTHAVFSSLTELAQAAAPREISLHPKFDALGWVGFRVSPKTWGNWFGSNAPAPKHIKVSGLDLCSQQVIRLRKAADDSVVVLPNGFYLEAIYGGLLSTMLAPSEAKEPSVDLLFSRARAYRPLSPLHLHLDALELRGFADDWGNVPWDSVISIAAHRIFDELHKRWRPVDGAAYEDFSSDLRQQWITASEERRSEIRGFYKRLTPDIFDVSMAAGAYPKMQHGITGADIQPAQMHRFLFALGIDENFWVGDRLLPWSLDLATAGLVAYALAWTDRYRLLGHRITEEGVFLHAINALLFSSERVGLDSEKEGLDAHLEEIEADLRAAMDLCDPRGPRLSYDAFKRCRNSYLTELGALGVSVAEIETISAAISERRPLIYQSVRTCFH